mmetsp:Transcript_23745/g.28006  ORF Transcript_23745/g.28006 Transcript_23745/m.28006 type:complete len:132 (+) Transcript_23745:127-522(+)
MGDRSSNGRVRSILRNGISSLYTNNAISSHENNDNHFKLQLKNKQQRLLLLHHSAKCQYDDGQCSVSSHCNGMKNLWDHMATCSDTKCQVPHCYSSRSILTHYTTCRDQVCLACGPVRDSVLKCQTDRQDK